MPLPSLIVPLSVKKISNKLVPNFSNNIPRNPPFCSFALFLIVLLTLYINKPDSSSDLTIDMMSFISSVKTINVVIRETKSEGQTDPSIFL